MTRAHDGFFEKNDAEIRRDIDESMSVRASTRLFGERERVALACRILAERGHANTLAGQITVRTEARDSFLTTNFELGFGETSVGNLLRVDDEMGVLEGNGMANPALRFHMWIYKARPEVNCIVHTHPTYCSALSMTGEQLVVAHMDATMFYDDCAYLPEWPGVPVANEEGRIISAALGQKRSILLAHHGMLTAGKSLEEAVYLAVLLEQAAQQQILARSVGPIKPIPPVLAADAHSFMLSEKIVDATFVHWARGEARKYPEALR